MKKAKLPTWVWTMFRAGISVAVLGLLFRTVDLQAMMQLFARLDFWEIAFAQALILFQIVATTWRWAIVLDSMQPPFRFSTACRIVFTAQFFGQLMPSAIGGDVLRVWYTHREGVPPGIALTSIILERVAGLVSMALTVLVVLPVLFTLVDEPNQRLYMLVCLCLVLAGFTSLFLLGLIPERFHKFRLVRLLLNLGHHTREIVGSPHLRSRVLGISVAGQIALSVAVFSLCNAIGAPVGLLSCLLLVPPTLLLTAFPISISGWGVREGAMVVSLGLAGVAPELALAVSLVYGVLSTLTGLPGLLLWLMNRREILEVKAGLEKSAVNAV